MNALPQPGAEVLLPTAQVRVGTWLLGLVIFIDDHLNAPAVGASMQRWADRFRISREMLASVVDSTAAPIGGWGVRRPRVMAAVVSAGAFGSHACFYGDATVWSAQGSGCEPMDHALSQFPYALLAAGLATAAFLRIAWV